MAISLNALAPTADINTLVELAHNTKNLVRPEVFYSKQLLDTIRVGSDQYVYYKLADVSPIQGKAEKLTVRRWSPLQAHTVPLVEGIPPKSDKGSVEKYEMEAHQYGRYMEFTDKVDFTVVDPVIAHYSAEYSIVAIETLDMLAREELFSKAQPFYASAADGTPCADFDHLTVDDAKPNMTDLRLIVLSLQRQLVKPRASGRYEVIVSPEWTYDMISDPTVVQFMTINQTTKDLFDGSVLFPMFHMTFKETLIAPATGTYEYLDAGTGELVRGKRFYALSADGATPPGSYTPDTIGDYDYVTIPDTDTDFCIKQDAYIRDPRTGQDASYIPQLETWITPDGWTELKVHHILIVGKDALTRTGLEGEGNAKMYTKQKGSAGVLDPIDQRQSIGFKINSVGFGSTRLEAIVDYRCVPSTANLV